MARRAPRTPFVFTVAAAAASVFSPGCGGETSSSDPEPAGGSAGTGGTAATGGTGGSTGGSSGSGASGGSGGTTGGAGGTTGGSGGTTGGAGGVGGGPNCPASLPSSYEQCAPDGSTCLYDVACQSGTVSFTLVCEYGYWNVAPDKCAQPYDSCPGTMLHCDASYGWTMPQGTNPPSPCPDAAPPVGEQCYSGGFGGVHEKCGYPCDPATKSGWTVMTCPYEGGTESKWQSDGACGG